MKWAHKKGVSMIAPRRRQPRSGGPSTLSFVSPTFEVDARAAGGVTLGDEDLLDRIGRGDTAAFELFYDRHCDAAYGLALRILGETEAACATVEEVFVQMWREPIRRGRPRETARASLLSRVNRCALDALRHPVPPLDRHGGGA